MVRPHRRALLRSLVLALLVCGVALARPALAVAADPRAVDEALALSDVRRQVEQLARRVMAESDRFFKGVPPETKSQLDAVLTEAYDPAAMFAEVRSVFLGEFDAGRGMLVLAFLRSPLAQTMTRLEGEARTEEAAQELRGFTARLRATPPDPARVALVNRLASASRQTEIFLNVTLSALRSLLVVGNIALAPKQRQTAEQVEKRLGALRAQLEPGAKETVLWTELFTYRSVSDDDVRAYVEFFESEMGRWFLDLLNRGVTGALQRSGTIAAARSLEAMRKADGRSCVGLPCRPTP